MAMNKVIYGPSLRAEYQALFNTCEVRKERRALVQTRVSKIKDHKERYGKIAAHIPGMPWWFVGVIHNMECSLSFEKHLHNGDPLTARTTHVPAGQPKTGTPPFTFEQSAQDALNTRFAGWHDWDIPGVLYRLELYNGLGYRQYHAEVKSPYLWSFTNHYSKGKYVADGKFNPNAISQQIGCAALMRYLT